MTFIKYKSDLIILLLIFMLSGCGNKDNHYVDNSQSFVTEQPNIEDGKTIISRIRRISDADDYMTYGGFII